MIRNSFQAASLSCFDYQPKLNQSRSAAQLRLQAYQDSARGKENIHLNLTPDRSPNRLGSKQKPSVDHDSSRKSNTMVLRSNGFQRIGSFSPFSKHRQQSSLSPEMSKLQDSMATSGVKVCMNHPQKKAKYASEGGELDNFYYCSKCAIRLVSQGFKVREIGEVSIAATSHSRSMLGAGSEDESQRQNQINKLIGDIQKSRPKLQNNLSLLQRMRKDFIQHYKNLLANQDQMFDQLIEELNRQKKLKRAGLQTLADDGSNQLNQMEKSLTDMLQDMALIKDDLKTQLPLIKTRVSAVQYRRIMTSYQQKVQNSQSIVEESQQIDLRMAEPDHMLLQSLRGLSKQMKRALHCKDQLSNVQFSFEEKEFKKRMIIEEQEEFEEQGYENQAGLKGEYDDDGYSPNFKHF